MASLIYNHMLNALTQKLIDFDSDTIKVMLVTDSYVPNKDTHHFRSDVSNEVGTSGDYVSGGATITVTNTEDDTNDRTDITFGSKTWNSTTITARGAVIYQSTGSAATDILIAYVDFGTNISSTNGPFEFVATSPLRFQN